MIRTWGFILALAALLLAPGAGNPSVFAVLEKVGSRINTPVTEQEQAELTFFECLEETSRVIPNLSRVEKVLPEGDSYIVQRVGDVMYPRVRFDADAPEFRLYVNSDPAGAKLLASAQCGAYFVGVEKVD